MLFYPSLMQITNLVYYIDYVILTAVNTIRDALFSFSDVETKACLLDYFILTAVNSFTICDALFSFSDVDYKAYLLDYFILKSCGATFFIPRSHEPPFVFSPNPT